MPMMRKKMPDATRTPVHRRSLLIIRLQKRMSFSRQRKNAHAYKLPCPKVPVTAEKVPDAKNTLMPIEKRPEEDRGA